MQNTFDIKFPEEKELLIKFFKRQLEVVRGAKNSDDLDNAIDPIVVLHQRIAKYASGDNSKALTDIYGFIASDDWTTIDNLEV